MTTIVETESLISVFFSKDVASHSFLLSKHDADLDHFLLINRIIEAVKMKLLVKHGCVA
jgi:hypothetical protein